MPGAIPVGRRTRSAASARARFLNSLETRRGLSAPFISTWARYNPIDGSVRAARLDENEQASAPSECYRRRPIDGVMPFLTGERSIGAAGETLRVGDKVREDALRRPIIMH